MNRTPNKAFTSEMSCALHLQPGELPTESNRYWFYVLSWESAINWNRTLIRIGISKNPISRIGSHKSSFPGWRYLALFETDMADSVERFFERIFNEFLFQGGKSVYLLPERELRFLVASAGFMCGSGDTTCWESLAPGLAKIDPDERLSRLIQYDLSAEALL